IGPAGFDHLRHGFGIVVAHVFVHAPAVTQQLGNIIKSRPPNEHFETHQLSPGWAPHPRRSVFERDGEGPAVRTLFMKRKPSLRSAWAGRTPAPTQFVMATCFRSLLSPASSWRIPASSAPGPHRSGRLQPPPSCSTRISPAPSGPPPA